MSDLNPAEIYRRYERNELDEAAAVGYLKLIIENSSDDELRVRSVELLGEMDLKAAEIFKFLEHLAASDACEEIRIASVQKIIANYLEVGVNHLKWVFQYEKSIKCLLEILKSLQSSTSIKAKELISIFERIIGERFIQIDEYNKEKRGIGQIERFLR